MAVAQVDYFVTFCSAARHLKIQKDSPVTLLRPST
jgi:hypothetical protein